MMLSEGNCFAHWHIGFTLAGKPCLRSDTCKDVEAMDIADRVVGAVERAVASSAKKSCSGVQRRVIACNGLRAADGHCRRLFCAACMI
jgi:hypothetical protein